MRPDPTGIARESADAAAAVSGNLDLTLSKPKTRSSLSYLTQFPVSKLKIDHSFIRNVATNQEDAAITTAVIGMARSLNLRVIAEGVDDEAHLTFLRAHHCGEIQGYYFSKPLLVADAAAKLRGTMSDALHL